MKIVGIRCIIRMTLDTVYNKKTNTNLTVRAEIPNDTQQCITALIFFMMEKSIISWT